MPTALETLVAERRRFQEFLARRVGDADEAEDLLQDALLRALKSPPADDDPEGTVRWFYRVLRNALIDRNRRAGTRGRALDQLEHEPRDEDPDLWQAVCGCLGALMEGLPPNYAEILKVVDLGDRAVTEAAGDLGISAGNARVRLHRARQALRAEVESFCRTCATHGCRDCTCRSSERKGV